ncbi:MAG: hypothetical protein K2K26_05080 [Muribaculaceae bacterium]|nr:hypothetical protein [Muribaculaceae bacterium]
MKYLSILFLILSMVITSCNNDDDQLSTSSQYRISFIYSDETTQTFDYNSVGNIKEWHYLETPTSQTIANASYNYDADRNSVKIDVEELHGDQKLIFDEVLLLNTDGTAKSAEGVVELFRVKDNGLLMKKKYSVVLSYNELKQLKSIEIEERLISDKGDDSYPLKWNIDLVWSNNNIMECREYSNSTSPLTVYEYTYYGVSGVDYAPIVQYPILRAYYTPLWYQGYFGMQSKGLVKKATVDKNYSIEYSFNISTNSTNSIVEGYFEKLPSGKEIKYTIGWE